MITIHTRLVRISESTSVKVVRITGPQCIDYYCFEYDNLHKRDFVVDFLFDAGSGSRTERSV